MNGRINIFITALLLLMASIVGVYYIATLRDESLQFAIPGVLGGIFLILSIKPKLSLDLKILVFAISGYALAGKGFAYLSPTPSLPLFIGEITLVFGLAGLILFRWSEFLYLLKRSPLLKFLLIIIILCGIRTLFDYIEFKLFAIRDSSMIYYAFFAFISATICIKESNRKVFTKCLIVSTYLALFSNLLVQVGVAGKIYGFVPYYLPHADTLIPFIIGAFFHAYYKFRRGQKIFLIPLIACLGIIGTSKAAYGFAFIIVCLFLIFIAGRKEIRNFALASCTLVGLSIAVISATGGSNSINNDLLSTVQVLGEDEEEFEGSTTDWRLTWWRIITEQTMEQAPVMGTGFGSDISTAFYLEEYGRVVDPYDPRLPRYPHNFFFTVFGRLGMLGIAGLLLFVGSLAVFFRRFARRVLRSKDFDLIDLMAVAIALSGLANAFVQSTYEAPFAAVTHWSVIGFLITRQIVKDGKPQSKEDELLAKNEKCIEKN